MMDIHQILKQLPHRYPILLVDRVLAIENGKSIRALKNVTMNEPYFTGHFPHRPVMPGVLIIEALAQSAALLSFAITGSTPDDKSIYYFAGIAIGCVMVGMIMQARQAAAGGGVGGGAVMGGPDRPGPKPAAPVRTEPAQGSEPGQKPQTTP